MITRLYRLMDAKRIELVQREVAFSRGDVLIRPEHLAICAADQRYYLGRRRKEILAKKLPMALIHEATGTVLHDTLGRFAPGAKVVLIPLMPGDGSEAVKGNYRETSRFASSGEDGFMRDIIALRPERLIPVPGDYSPIYVFSELLSVAAGAVSEFEKARRTGLSSFGVWGDGSMGFMMSLALRCLYPGAKIYVFGKSARKLGKFSFATKVFSVDRIPPGFRVDHGFECVGGANSGGAIAQMIETVSPQGVLCLLGVSEEAVPLDTRRVLDKGLLLLGNSRSDAEDFQRAVGLISECETCRKYLHLLISQTVDIRSESDIPYAFDQDVLNDFKTVMKWSI